MVAITGHGNLEAQRPKRSTKELLSLGKNILAASVAGAVVSVALVEGAHQHNHDKEVPLLQQLHIGDKIKTKDQVPEGQEELTTYVIEPGQGLGSLIKDLGITDKHVAREIYTDVRAQEGGSMLRQGDIVLLPHKDFPESQIMPGATPEELDALRDAPKAPHADG